MFPAKFMQVFRHPRFGGVAFLKKIKLKDMITVKLANNCHNPFKNKKRTGDFYTHIYLTLWQGSNPDKTWEHAGVSFGIRRSDKLQWFLPWNTSHNCRKAIMFGIWKFYIEFFYAF